MSPRTAIIKKALITIAHIATKPLDLTNDDEHTPDTYTERATTIIQMATNIINIDSITDEQFKDAVKHAREQRKTHNRTPSQMLFNSRN